MKKITGLFAFLLLLAGMNCDAQQINKLEYFIDADPGFGNATNVSVTASANIANLSVPVSISSLSRGFHHVSFRSKDNAGNWSLTNCWTFIKDIIGSTANKLEYFIDTDPGFGNGTDVPVSPSANISNIAIPVSISSLSKGFHNIFLRSRDNTGNWSLTNRWTFVKDAVAVNASKVEYFIDTDPGFGNGTNVTITPSANVADITIPVSVNSLSKGFHSIYFRSKDNAGAWSLTNRWLLFKDVAQDNLAGGEYFFDTDPGFGNGTAIPFGSLGMDAPDFSFAADASVLPTTGSHLLFIRIKEANGKWSLTNVLPFDYLGPVPVKLLNFQVKAEDDKAVLSWQTSSEQNSDRFEIERMGETESHFIKIGTTKAAGNSDVLHNYSFVDQTPQKGTNYYRLKEVDLDGRLQYSAIRTADFMNATPLSLYNSFTSGTPVQVKVYDFPATLSVFDAAGKKMKEIIINNNLYALPVAGFANGTYLVVLSKEGKMIAAERFVVNR